MTELPKDTPAEPGSAEPAPRLTCREIYERKAAEDPMWRIMLPTTPDPPAPDPPMTARQRIEAHAATGHSPFRVAEPSDKGFILGGVKSPSKP